MKIFNKYNLIFKTTFFSILVFLGSFNVCFSDEKTAPWWNLPGKALDGILTGVANLMLTISAQILNLAGNLFNISLQFTLNFKALADSTGVVNIGWTIIRDMSNMAFIFILLSVAIGTILGLSGHNAKNTIKNIILAALFINFSLFITNVIIDASNVMAFGFYNATIQEAGKVDKGISEIFMQALDVRSIYDPEGLPEGTITHNNILSIGIFGSLLMLITAFVFFAAAILFMIRLVVLMFLMMISPIAFIGSILPKTQGMAKRWWSELFSQAFFAPVYLMFVYIVASGITSTAFKVTMATAGNDDTFSGLFSASGGGTIIILFNFILIIALLLGALISAKSMGAAGAGGVISMGKGLQKWGQGAIGGAVGGATFGVGGRLARSTVGGWAQRKADAWAKDPTKGNTWASKVGLKTLRAVGDSSFDARNTTIGKAVTGAIPGGLGTGIKGGYKTKVEDREKAEIKYAQSLKGDSNEPMLDAKGKQMYGYNSETGKMDKPLKLSRTEVYGQGIENRSKGRNILASVIGTRGGDDAAAKKLSALAKANRELTEAKNKLKSENNEDLKKLRRQVKDKKDDLADIRQFKNRKPNEVEKQELYDLEDQLTKEESIIKEYIKSKEEAVKKAKDKTTIKDDKK